MDSNTTFAPAASSSSRLKPPERTPIVGTLMRFAASQSHSEPHRSGARANAVAPLGASIALTGAARG
jgi:hypothetical protein